VTATPTPIRTVLFVPGDDRYKIDKALGLWASAVMLDLEDGVAVDAKAAARATVAGALLAAPPASPPMGVRVNALASGLADADLDALAVALPRIALITVPMVESPDDVRHVAARLDVLERAAGVVAGSVALLAMTETARGILAAREIAASSVRLRTLLFGPGDLGRELAVEHTADGFEHLHARSAMVLAARAADKEGPIDGPYLKLDDDEGCAVSAAWARRLGFQGKVALHPRQLPITAAAFAPGKRELAWARAVDHAFSEAEAAGISSLKLADGTFVDSPVAQRARDILRASES
jgi:citrate lyase subunit beta / citryl-CoA lyase